MAECPCFYFDVEGFRAYGETCECGHELDEHDEWGDCKAVYVEAAAGPAEVRTEGGT